MLGVACRGDLSFTKVLFSPGEGAPHERVTAEGVERVPTG